MITDPIADFLIQVKNGYLARKANISISHSIVKEKLADVLSKAGFIGKVQVQQEGKSKKLLVVELSYQGKTPKLTEIVRVSKISRRIYVKKGRVPRVLGGRGMAIISTPGGFMTDNEARKKGMGGEVICKVW